MGFGGHFAFQEPERERFESTFPNHKTVLLEDAGHFIQEDAPDEIVDAIKTWYPTIDVAENCLFRQIRILSREIESSYTNSMKQIGVTPAQFALMTAIRLLKEANMNRLSEVTKTDRTTINRNLKPLSKREVCSSARESGSTRKGYLYVTRR